MTGSRTPASVVGLGLGCLLSLGNCADTGSGTLPEARLEAEPVTAEMVAPAPLRAAHLAPAAAATCGAVTVEAKRPVRMRGGKCERDYLVNLSVETDLADTSILGMFRSYDMADWRVRTTEGRVKHEVSLIWRPYTTVGFPEVTTAARVRAEPLLVRTCPDGSGPVVACSGVTCDTYASEDQVPPVSLPARGGVFEAPWSYENVQELEEDSTLQVPVRYSLRQGRSVKISLRHAFYASGRSLRITPRQRSVSSGRSGTVSFTILAVLDALPEPPSVEELLFVVEGGADCVVAPNRIRVRVRDQ